MHISIPKVLIHISWNQKYEKRVLRYMHEQGTSDKYCVKSVSRVLTVIVFYY